MDEVDIAAIDVKPAELELAVQLIEQIATDKFTPDQYHDEVKVQVQEAIQNKVESEEIIAGPIEAPKAQIIDLMKALKG